MNILLLGAAGFIGTNLTIKLAEETDNNITLIDKRKTYFSNLEKFRLKNIKVAESDFELDMDFDPLFAGQDVIYHLVSTNVPSTSNQHISQELTANIIFTANLLEAAVRCHVKKIVFISSGGTVYGKEAGCPLKEDTPTNPISSYGVQKITIEKLLYLYRYLYGLDYRVIRLGNPYGPYQRPDGILGAVTTFTYKALKKEEIVVYGDGTVIRDYIYIDDAIRGMLNIADGQNQYRTFNLGCGCGTSIKDVLQTIGRVLDMPLNIVYKQGRTVDVPISFLDISRYEKAYGPLHPISLEEGIRKTASFMKEHYNI